MGAVPTNEVVKGRSAQAAVEGERARWARDLHDDTLQSLSALQVRLANARRLGRPEALEQAVDDAIGYLREGIADLRALITDLRPAALDELGVEAALEALAERTRRHGVEVDVDVELAPETCRDRGRHTPELENRAVSDRPGGAEQCHQARTGSSRCGGDPRGRHHRLSERA